MWKKEIEREKKGRKEGRKGKKKRKERKEMVVFLWRNLFYEHGDIWTIAFHFFALTARKLKTKHESGEVFSVQQSILFMHFTLSSLFFTLTSPLPQFPHFRLQNVVIIYVFWAALKHFWNKAKCIVINRPANNSQFFGLFDENIKALWEATENWFL